MRNKILLLALSSIVLFISCASGGDTEIPNASTEILGSFKIYWLITALAGGMFGAAIGPNFSFGFTGVMILVGIPVAMITGSDVGLSYIAFGPVFGPHITFAGGAAASAYAAKIGKLDTGRDINTQLVGLNNPGVLWVGGLFGMFGYLFSVCTTFIPWIGENTDNVALTVFTSGILARILFGVRTKSVISTSLKVDDKNSWLRWQESPLQLFTLAFAASLFAAGLSVAVHHYLNKTGSNLPGGDILKANIQSIPFAISAICIFFVSMGYKFPVTHQMTITAALAASVFYPLLGSEFGALGVGVLFGMFSGFLCELNARIFYNHGDTHIDPPASAIWITTSLIFLFASFCG